MGNSGSGFGGSSTAEEVAGDLDLRGYTVIVTGANSGIGKETCRVLAHRGAEVVLGCRSVDNGKAVEAEWQENCPNNFAGEPLKVHSLRVDLGNLETVLSFVQSIRELDLTPNVLVCNAGVMALPEYRLTADGIEMQFGVNHIGHFMLTVLLMPVLQAAAAQSGRQSRVVVVSSRAHEEVGSAPNFNIAHLPPLAANYSEWRNYGLSKLCNVLFAKELHRRFHPAGIIACSLHPGAIPTNLGRNNAMADIFYKVTPFLKTIPQGAATTMYCICSNEVEGGKYYADCKEKEPSEDARNSSYARLLWRLSERVVLEKTNGKVNVSEILGDDGDELQASTCTGGAKYAVPLSTWVDDSSVTCCALCERDFSVGTRRHHCRFCGRVVCGACSKNKMRPMTPPDAAASSAENLPEAERTCDQCWVVRNWSEGSEGTSE